MLIDSSEKDDLLEVVDVITMMKLMRKEYNYHFEKSNPYLNSSIEAFIECLACLAERYPFFSFEIAEGEVDQDGYDIDYIFMLDNLPDSIRKSSQLDLENAVSSIDDPYGEFSITWDGHKMQVRIIFNPFYKGLVINMEECLKKISSKL